MNIYAIIIFIFGLFMGSIFVKIGLRLPYNKSLFTKSRCTFCNNELSLIERIPLISYIIQNGRCKHCNSKIYVLYPIIELSTGLLYYLTYKAFIDVNNPTIAIILGIVFVSSLIIIFVCDVKYMLIPNELLIFFASIVLVLKILLGVKNEELLSFMDIGYELIFMFIDAAVMFIIMLIIKKLGKFLFKKDALGGGDVKMMAYISMLMGYKMSTVIIFLGSFIALPYSIYQAYKKEQALLPFGPYLAISTILLFLLKVDFNSLLELIH